MRLKNSVQSLNFKSLKRDLCKKIEIGLKQIEDGQAIPAELFFQEMEEKYNFNE